MSKSIDELVDELPSSGMTVRLLQGLDFLVPGQWTNLVGFNNTITTVTGESDPEMIRQIGERAIALYMDPEQGYQRAVWLYQTANSMGGKLGAAAMANKIGESVSFLSFMSSITPKADNAQMIDFCLKLTAEVVAYYKINGIPGDGMGEFMGALGDYGKESVMRLAALVTLDGLVPLGPDFLKKVESGISGMDFTSNPVFNALSGVIPGADKAGFVTNAFHSMKDWMNSFVAQRGLTPQGVVGNLKNFIDVSDDKLDYAAAFIDTTTNYFDYTGVQTVARRLVERAVAEI
jgi:hypothetical protein